MTVQVWGPTSNHRFPNDGSEKCQTPYRAWPCRLFTPNQFASCTKLFFRMESHNLVGTNESFSHLLKEKALGCVGTCGDQTRKTNSLQFARKFMKPRELFLCATNLQRILFPLWLTFLQKIEIQDFFLFSLFETFSTMKCIVENGAFSSVWILWNAKNCLLKHENCENIDTE